MYYFQPMTNCNVTISLCNSATFADQFDTKLWVVSNMLGTAPLQPIACNDDYCSYLSQVTVSMHHCPGVPGHLCLWNTHAFTTSTASACNVTPVSREGLVGMLALCRALRMSACITHRYGLSWQLHGT